MARKYSDEHIDYIRSIAKGNSYKRIAELFAGKYPQLDMTESKMKGLLARFKITNGLNGRFGNGHGPWNKGKPFQAGGHSAETRFKKGQPPINHLPVGSERIDAKDGYRFVKVAEPDKWELKHRIVWEKAHGKVPKSHVIIFLDQNRLNCDIDNLALITRGELARINKRVKFSDDQKINLSIILNEKIKTKTNELEGV
jgi:hypothetical protein